MKEWSRGREQRHSGRVVGEEAHSLCLGREETGRTSQPGWEVCWCEKASAEDSAPDSEVLVYGAWLELALLERRMGPRASQHHPPRHCLPHLPQRCGT